MPSVAARYVSGRFGAAASSQVQTVLLKQEDRARHPFTVGFDQMGDTRQDFVQGSAEEDQLQRIEHRFARQGLRGGSRRWRRLILEVRWRFGVCHKQSAYQHMPGVSHKKQPAIRYPPVLSESAAETKRCAYFARGSGRIWTFTTLSLVPLPPSMCQGVLGL